ncbi:tyrS, partial [Symbiodinium sp. KB8]
VLERLRAADGHRVLWLEDWSAKCLGAAGGSVDCVKGFYNLFLHGLRSLDPKLLEEVEWTPHSSFAGELYAAVMGWARRDRTYFYGTLSLLLLGE